MAERKTRERKPAGKAPRRVRGWFPRIPQVKRSGAWTSAWAWAWERKERVERDEDCGGSSVSPFEQVCWWKWVSIWAVI